MKKFFALTRLRVPPLRVLDPAARLPFMVTPPTKNPVVDLLNLHRERASRPTFQAVGAATAARCLWNLVVSLRARADLRQSSYLEARCRRSWLVGTSRSRILPLGVGRPRKDKEVVASIYALSLTAKPASIRQLAR